MFNWLELSNPVALWWIFLISVAVINICAWFFTLKYLSHGQNIKAVKVLIFLSACYVFGCAFRSFLPRADVQRICLFDTWFSCVFLGRSVATIAEIAFVAQWALVLHRVSILTQTEIAEKLSLLIVPLIVTAECFSWYAVITTHYLGNTCEESLWTVTYFLITICLAAIYPKLKGALKFAAGLAAIGCLFYIAFMTTVDVPMYFTRWQNDSHNGKVLLGFFDGIRDLNTRWVVTRNIADWKTEIPWMSLYFSTAVWTSIMLCYVPLTKERFLKHLK